MASQDMRLERDSMGELEVPANAYYGGNARRAELNFPISNLRLGRSFIKAIGQIKQSAAVVNLELNALDEDIANAIIASAERVINGEFDSSFVVDIFQTGSGTSTNMNANEVISNVAIESLGGELGSRNPVHPNDHVNKGQSSNDVFPSTIHLAAAGAIKDNLLPSLKELEDSLRAKSEEFWGVVKTGRTHLQDATPIRLGQEFLGYAGQLEFAGKRAEKALAELSVLALGGTAVGTGIGMHPEFATRVISRLRVLTGLDLSETTNHFQAQSTLDAAVSASGELKSIAVGMLKIANDVRWLGSGPRAGIGEISLPEVQPGSSIMAGKVNPVICMAVQQVAYVIQGNDTTVSLAALNGQMEINHFEPVIARALFNSIESLRQVTQLFRARCIEGLQVNVERSYENLATSTAISSLFLPVIGYKKVCELVRIADLEKRPFVDVVIQEGLINKGNLDELLRIAARPSST